MVTVTDQDIPGALAALFGAYAAKAKATQGANGALRARRRVKRKPYKKRPNKYHAALWPLCVEAATNYAARYTGTPIEPTARRIFAAAKRGDFPAKWWVALIHATTTYHTTTPTSVERTSPNPYAYRDPLNRPTIPTYPAATAGAAPARYAGSTAAQLYRDTLLVFRRDTYKADPPAALTDATRIIYKATGNTTAAASIRAARPLMGLCVAAAAGALGVAPITTTAPPLGKGTQVYPRYKNKKTPAPYYSASAAYNLTRLLNPARATTPPATFERATVDLAPLPALGYRYNNNTSITTSTALTSTPSARIPLQPLPASPFVLSNTAPYRLISPYTGESLATNVDASRADNYSAGLYYFTFYDYDHIKLFDDDGEEYGLIPWRSRPGLESIYPHSWPGGWMTIENTGGPGTYDTIFRLYDWYGAIQATHSKNDPAWANYQMESAAHWRAPNIAQVGTGALAYVMNYNQHTSQWLITGIPGSFAGVMSGDGIHAITTTGAYYFAEYPDTNPAIPGDQPPIVMAYVANVGYIPQTFHRARAGMLTYHPTAGFRHFNSDATYTQLALSTAYTIRPYSSCHYRIP